MTERLHFHFSLSCTGEGNGNPVQWSCLENPRDGRAWWAAIYGVAQGWTRLKWLSSSSQALWTGKMEILSKKIWLLCLGADCWPRHIYFILLSKSQSLSYNHLFTYGLLGIRCCMGSFSSCGEQGLFFIVVPRLLAAVAALVAPGTWNLVVVAHGLSSRGDGLSYSMTCGIVLDQESNQCPHIGRQSLYHWATREAQKEKYFTINLFKIIWCCPNSF